MAQAAKISLHNLLSMTTHFHLSLVLILHTISSLNKQQNIVGDGTQSPAELWAVLIETEGQLERAERQVRAISKTRVADMFLEGQVRTWTKQTCELVRTSQSVC
jgi:hypothetical protein